MTYVDRRLTPARLQALTEAGTLSRRYPQSRTEWLDLYNRRHEAYVGDPYSVADMKTLHLFRALDESGDVMAETRRLTRDVQYVVDTHVDAINAGLTLGKGSKGRRADVEAAQAIWDRSGLDLHFERYTRDAAALGDLHLEAVLSTEDGGAKIVAYDPRHVELTYDPESGTKLTRAVITVPYFEERRFRNGIPEGEHEVMRTYTRILTPGRIDVYRDGEHVPAESGATGLPGLTLVHVPYIPYKTPEYGLSAAHRLDDCLTLTDSMLTQIHAIGTRHGNPVLQSSGGKVGAGSNLGRHGRVVNGPENWTLKFVEPTFSGIATLLQAVQTHRETLRETMPEFLFTESGANSSGSALNFRATQFVQKLRKIRQRIYRAMEMVLEIGITLERGASTVRSKSILIEAGDILPANVTAMLEQLRITNDVLPLHPTTVVKHYQRTGLVPADVDPEEYATQSHVEEGGDEPEIEGDTRAELLAAIREALADAGLTAADLGSEDGD